LAASTSSCEDAPGDLVAKGILLTYDRIIDFSERAVRSNSAELNLDNDSSAISSCAAMQAMEGGCSLPEAEWLCPKTCGKCAKPTLSCLDCFTRPAFPLCYGEDAQRLPQCAMCRSGGCDSCASCTKPTELMPIIAKEPETDQTFMNGKYKKKISLMAGKYDVFWNVKGSMIEIALRVQTAGWIGFGLGERTTGGMGGSDIATVSVWPNGTSEITDRYAVGNAFPKADTCQDWKLVSASEANGVTTAEMTRALVTSDPQDQPLVANNMRAKVVLAYGADDSFGYHTTNRIAFQLDFFGDLKTDFWATVNDPDVDFFDITLNNFRIPAHQGGLCQRGTDCFDQTTTYHEACRDISELDGVQMIANAPLIEGGDIGNPELHHFVVWGHDTPDCGSGQGDFIYGWAPGAKEFVFPKEAGVSFGKTGLRSLKLQTHYDNPQLKVDRRDSSGVRFYYTKKRRQHEAGVLVFGDLYMMLGGLPLPDGISRYEISCPDAFSRCSEEERKTTLQVITSQLHMHKTGVRMTVQQRRAGGLDTKLEGQFYNFAFQDTNPINYTIGAGEEWITTCYYNNQGKRTKWGLGSNDEMCQNFVSYYPKMSCLGTSCGLLAGGKLVSNISLPSEAALGRTFGSKPTQQCLSTASPVPAPTQAPNAATQAPLAEVVPAPGQNAVKVAVNSAAPSFHSMQFVALVVHSCALALALLS